MKPPKPVTIPEEMAAKYTNADQAQRFDAALRKVLAVSHDEILRREAEYRQKSLANPKRRGPKPRLNSQ